MGFEKFEGARELRESLRPKLRVREMARKMNVSQTYVSDLESGVRGANGWPAHRKRDYLRIIEQWKKKPTPRVRKKRLLKVEMIARREAALATG